MKKILSSLRGQLMLLVLLTSIPIMIVLVIVSTEQRQRAINEAQAEVVRLSRIAASREAELVSNAQAFLVLLANLPDLRNMNVSGCNEMLTSIANEHYKYYASFWVADLKGNVVCSPPGKHTPHDFDTCQHYLNLLDSTGDDFILSNYHICEHTGLAVLSLGLPINNYAGERVYVSSISLNLAWIYDFAAEAGLPEGAELTVLDGEGTILAHYPENDEWRGQMLMPGTAVYTILNSKQPVVIGADLNGRNSIAAISPLSNTRDQIQVVLSLPTALAFQPANETLVRTFLILLVVLLVSVGIMWVASSKLILQPVEKLVGATQKLASGDLSSRSQMDYQQGELGQLAKAFDSMASELDWREAERSRHLRELNDYARELEDSNRELTDFASIAAHDLREPLRKIITFNDLLKTRHQSKLGGEATNYIQRIQGTAHRMLTLLDDLRDYSQVTLQSRPFKTVHLDQVVLQVLQNLDLQIRQEQAKLDIDDLPVIMADETQMSQLIENLVSNAIKFHPPGVPPVVQIKNLTPAPDASPNGTIAFQVADQGVGFDPRYLDRLFVPFERLHPREEFEGTGMGLAICRKIVSRHGGEIIAESSPGQGARFTVRLPRTQPTPKAEKTP